MPLGAMIGSILGGIFSTKFGRKKTCMIADLLGILGCAIWVIKGTSPLLIGRFVCGLAVGINSVIVPLYINEVSPALISGMMGAMISLMISCGMFVTFLLSLNIPDAATIRAAPDDQNWWRFVFAFPIITCTFRSLVLLFIFKFETSQYLISIGKDDETAKFIITKLYHQEFVEQIYREYKTKVNNCQDVSFKELLGTKYRWSLVTGVLLGMFQHFSGATSVMFYSAKILENDSMAKIFTMLIGITLIVASTISGQTIDKLGRKTILLLGEIVCIITLIILIIFGYLLMLSPSKYVILVYMFNFEFSLGPILWLYLAEILPEKGVSVSAVANWFAAGLIGLCFPILNDIIQIQGTLLIFLGVTSFSLIYTFFCVKETKGRRREEMKICEDKENDKENVHLSTEEKIMTIP